MNQELRIKQRGFTLIELLVVVAIIGLLSSIISFAVSTTRIKARDTKRVTDMKQVKTGLDLYFQHGSGYPDVSVWNAAIGASLSCEGTDLLQIPKDPVSPTYQYTYRALGNSYSGCGAIVRSDFEVEFYIENNALYYIMNSDGNVRESASGNPVTFDDLL